MDMRFRDLAKAARTVAELFNDVLIDSLDVDDVGPIPPAVLELDNMYVEWTRRAFSHEGKHNDLVLAALDAGELTYDEAIALAIPA